MATSIENTAVEPESGDIVIMVMGISGSGKSNFIAKATGESPYKSFNSKPGKYKISTYRYGSHESKTVWLADTSGLDHPYRSDSENLRDICEFLAQLREQNISLYGFIYLHRIAYLRFSEFALRNLNMFQMLVPKSNMGSVLIATTRWDRLNDVSVGAQREQRLKVTDFTNLLDNGASLFRFLNTEENAQFLVDIILVSGKSQILPIQIQLVDYKMPLPETDLGLYLEQDMLKVKLDHEMEKAEYQTALKLNDAESAEVPAQTAKASQDTLRLLDQHIESLRRPVFRHSKEQQHCDSSRSEVLNTPNERANEKQDREKPPRQLKEYAMGETNDEDISLSAPNSRNFKDLENTTIEDSRFTVLTTYSESAAIKNMGGVLEEVPDFDRMTILTDKESLTMPLALKDRLIEIVALKITESITIDPAENKDAINRVATALPELLKEFSQELEVQARPGIERDSTIFIRHYRKHITTSFQHCTAPEESSCLSLNNIEGLSVEEKLDMWNIRDSDGLQLDDEEGRGYAGSDSSSHSEDTKPFTGLEDQVPDLAKAWDFLFSTKMFEDLQIRIQASSVLTGRQYEATHNVRRTILSTLTQRSPNSAMKQSFFTIFRIDWDPIMFFAEQYPNGAPPLGQVISITGSLVDAQALTVRSYIECVWPLSGVLVLEALQEAIWSDLHSTDCKKDGVRFNINLTSGEFGTKFEVHGSLLFLTDVGEILSWLAAALRSLPATIGPVISTNTIDVVHSVPASFQIGIRLTKSNAVPQNGICWHSLFRGQNIAGGFPILARSNNEKGLEIPLIIIAELGGADRVTIYNDQLLIKGFSTIIPYFAAKRSCPSRVKIGALNYSDLQLSRHFLGWSSSTQLLTGTTAIDYQALKYTGSNFSSAGCALEKVTISAGKFIKVGGTFVPGMKDSRLSLTSPEPYILKMHAASRMHVVMYDTIDRRAWLIDGANALLHLTRAQLTQKPYCTSDMLDLDEFPHADPERGVDAALEALKEIESKDLPIFEERAVADRSRIPEPRWRIKDIVLNLWHILEQMQDHQTELAGPGMPLRLTDRDKLEGFGLLDVISGGTSIRPRVVILKQGGRGWVDFIREIQAVTFMAQGLGNLIVPTEHSNVLCSAWKEVPKGHDFLAACISQLRDICEQYGDLKARPLELVQNLYWHQDDKLFESCINTCSANCDRVQMLLSKATLDKRKCPDPFETLDGAVVFGKSNRVSKWWPKNSQVGPQDNEAACISEDSKMAPVTDSGSFDDSGVGLSRSNVGLSSEAGTSIEGRISPEGQSANELTSTAVNLSHGDMRRGEIGTVRGRFLAYLPSRKGKEVVRPFEKETATVSRQSEQVRRSPTSSTVTNIPKSARSTSSQKSFLRGLLSRRDRGKGIIVNK